MKKYLITHDQLTQIDAVFDSIVASESWMKTIKPIKPLTDKQIMKRLDVEYVTPLIRNIVQRVEAAHGIK